MSNASHHIYRGFSVRFDELEPQNSITMSKATWTALEQLETGKEEIAAKRYQVKSKPKFADGPHELESHYASKHEAESRARSLKDAGYSTEIVEPTEADVPVSKGRFRVHYQQNVAAPFLEESSFDVGGDAQAHARELEDKGFGTQIIDSSNGAVVQNVYPDGTAVAPETEFPGTVRPLDADGGPLPEHPAIENQPPAPEEHHEGQS
jgi:hypothetical protein